MDNTQIITTAITTTGAIVVALITNRKESTTDNPTGKRKQPNIRLFSFLILGFFLGIGINFLIPHQQKPAIINNIPANTPPIDTLIDKAPLIDGTNVGTVYYSDDKETGNIFGSFKINNQGFWAEENANNTHWIYRETNRNKLSVYLKDTIRGIPIQLDLSKKIVYINNHEFLYYINKVEKIN